MMASAKKKLDEKNLKLLRELASQPHNKKCFDCGQRGPTYVNMTIGSFVCTSCSGILRGLNPPQRVKSISMTSFTQQEIEFLQGAGNEMCKKTWLGLWNSANNPEPESRDEQKVKDFMIQKYERRRWYIPPQQVQANSTSSSTSVSEAKPLKQLLGKDSPVLQTSSSSVSTASRERPRTSSQTSIPSAVPPPISHHEPAPPQPAKPATSFDLLSDFGSDPFAQQPPQQQQQLQGFAAFGSQPQQQSGGIPGFGAFNQAPAPAASQPQQTFDPFGSMQSAQPAQPAQQTGFANFGQPQPQPQQQTQQLQQQQSFDAFGSFSSPASSAGVSQSSGFGPMVSASAPLTTSASNPPQAASTADRYAALSELDSLFGPSPTSTSSTHNAPSSSGSIFGSTTHNAPTSSGSIFGSTTHNAPTSSGSIFGGTSSSMSSGPNPFSSGSVSAQQPASTASSNPFQGLGSLSGSGGTFPQMNGPGRSMSPSSTGTTGITSSAGFGSFSSAQSTNTSFGQPTAQQPQAMPGWGQSMGMQPSTASQNFSLGGAGMTVMAANQFGKMSSHNPSMGNQPDGFGGMQSGFGSGSQMGGSTGGGFGQWGSQSNQPSSQASSFGGHGQMDGFGGQSQGFRGGQSGFGTQQSGFGGQQSGFPGQQSAFGGQQQSAFGGAQQSGFGGQQSGFGGQQPGFGGQQSGFGGQQSGFGGQQSGFGGQQGFGQFGQFGQQQSASGLGGGMVGGSQFGQQQQPQQQQQQFGGWQQSSQQNPFMGGGGQPQMQQQSTNPFM